MRRSTPKAKPEFITGMKKEAYMNSLNAGSFLFSPSAVLQAAACDGTKYTTSAEGEDIAPGTLPNFILLVYIKLKTCQLFGRY